MSDLKLKETGSGGDLIFNGNDLEVVEGFQNMPYLGMYGGNLEQNTKEFLPDEQRFDCWFNNLLLLKNSNIQLVAIETHDPDGNKLDDCDNIDKLFENHQYFIHKRVGPTTLYRKKNN